MQTWKIYSKAGADFGVWPGETAEQAFAAMVAEGGGEVGAPHVGTAADWIINEADKPVTLNGKSISFDAAVNLMDDQLREELHSTLAQCTDQEFLDAYVKAHAAKFAGEEFRVA